VLFLWKPPFFKKCKLLLGTSQNIGPSWDKRKSKHNSYNKVGARITKKDIDKQKNIKKYHRTSKNISENAIKSITHYNQK